MQKLPVVLFREEDGSVPILVWLDGEVARRNRKIPVECRARIDLLSDPGPKELPLEITKPLRDGVWELRIEYQQVNYRMLYFFSRHGLVVVSHGCWKEAEVPGREIDLALRRKRLFESDPEKHTYVWTRRDP